MTRHSLVEPPFHGQQSHGENVAIVLYEQAGVAGIFLTEKHLRKSFVDQFVSLVESLPSEFTLMFGVDEYGEDQRGIWQIPEVRDFLRRVLLRAPQILPQFSIEQRHLFRLCFRDVSHVHGAGVTLKSAIYYTMDPRWQNIASVTGLDPELLA